VLQAQTVSTALTAHKALKVLWARRVWLVKLEKKVSLAQRVLLVFQASVAHLALMHRTVFVVLLARLVPTASTA